MTTSETLQFSEFWDAIRAAYDKPHLAAVVMTMDFATLSRYSLDDIVRAVAAHRGDPERGIYCPVPADVVRHIERARRAATDHLALPEPRHWPEPTPEQRAVLDEQRREACARVRAMLKDLGDGLARDAGHDEERPTSVYRERVTRVRADGALELRLGDGSWHVMKPANVTNVEVGYGD